MQGTPTTTDSHCSNTCEEHKETQPGSRPGTRTKDKPNPGSFQLLSCGFHPVKGSKSQPHVPSAPWETAREGVGGAGLRSALGGSFVFVRNNDINHSIKQKPLRGRISKLAQHRAQPAGELPASGHSRQIPWDSSSAAKATEGRGDEQIQDCCRTRAWKCESERSAVRCLLGIHPNGTASLPLALQVNLACGLHNLLT